MTSFIKDDCDFHDYRRFNRISGQSTEFYWSFMLLLVSFIENSLAVLYADISPTENTLVNGPYTTTDKQIQLRGIATIPTRIRLYHTYHTSGFHIVHVSKHVIISYGAALLWS